jgi:hypothetical protein
VRARALAQLTAFKKSGFMSRVFTVELQGAEGAPPERIAVLPKEARALAHTNAHTHMRSPLRCRRRCTPTL